MSASAVPREVLPTRPPGERHWDRAFTSVIIDEMRRDPAVVLMGLEVSSWSVGLVSEFGSKRVIDTPISEGTVLGMAVGAARVGLRPVVDLWHSSFLYPALDQFFNGLALSTDLFRQPAPVLIKMRTGVPQRTPGTTHARMPHGLLAAVPGVDVIFPATVNEVGALVRSALCRRRPAVFLEHIDLCKMDLDGEPDQTAEVGVANVVRRGADVTVVGVGPTVRHCLDAAQILAQLSVDVEVIDLRTLRPLDLSTVVESVLRTGCAVVVDEAHEVGAFGSWLAQKITQTVPRATANAITAADQIIPYAPHHLPRGLIPGPDSVVEAVHNALRRVGGTRRRTAPR